MRRMSETSEREEIAALLASPETQISIARFWDRVITDIRELYPDEDDQLMVMARMLMWLGISPRAVYAEVRKIREERGHIREERGHDDHA